MFNFLNRSKGQKVSTPETKELNYSLTAEQKTAFEKLVADADGFVAIGDVTHGIFHQQSQYITRYMDGSPSFPSLVDGLRVNVDSSSHHDYTIHKDDILEFVARVKTQRSLP